MNDFHGKKVLLTGGTRGIGASTANLLAQNGCEVHITYAHSEDRASEMEQASKDFSGSIIAHYADASNPEAIQTFGQDFLKKVPAIDFLILNAGVFTMGVIGETTLEEFQRVSNINEVSVFALANTLAPSIVDGGRMVVISSILGEHSLIPGLSIYNASKASVSMMARTWARDLAPRNILVNAVQPGPVDTDLNPDIPENPGASSNKAQVPLGRYGKPEEIAGVIEFLCSNKASYVTGACINVDGGWIA